MTSLAVIGGGISGLTAAYYAAAAGMTVIVFEAAPQVGGKLRAAELAGVPVDVGAEAMLTTRPEGVSLLADLALTDARISPLTMAAQVRSGRASHPLPARTLMGIPTDPAALRASGVLTPAGVAVVEREPELAPMPPLDDDVAVGPLVRGRLGAEVVDRLVEPLLGGVYAGRADGLSLQATLPGLAAALAGGGSLLAAAASITGAGTRAPGAGAVFTSLRGGLGRLPHEIADTHRFAVRTSTTVRSIRRTSTGFQLECGAVPVAELIDADAVIVAAPAAKAARLLRSVTPSAAAELGGIDSASIAIVSLAYADVTLPPGSGLLIAAGERLAIKGVTLSSQKWPLPAGPTLLRASVGRAGEPHALQFDDADLVRLVRQELRAVLGIDAEPLDSMVTRWGAGLPQYAVGHLDRIARVRSAVGAVPGLAVCGAAFDGVGIPACIGAARAAVDQVVAGLHARGQ